MLKHSSQSAKERAALSRLRQVLIEPGLLRANLIKMRRPCGAHSCHCAKGKRHWHLSWYLSQSKDGKHRMKCVPKEQLDEVRTWVARYQDARRLLAVAGDERWNRIGRRRSTPRRSRHDG